MKKKTCTCDETLIADERVPAPQWHNCEYISRVNGYVGLAAVQACEVAGTKDNARWMWEFNSIMNTYRDQVIKDMDEEEALDKAEKASRAKARKNMIKLTTLLNHGKDQ